MPFMNLFKVAISFIATVLNYWWADQCRAGCHKIREPDVPKLGLRISGALAGSLRALCENAQTIFSF